MNTQPLSWSRAETPEALHNALSVLGEDYPLTEGGDGRQLLWSPADDAERLQVQREATGIRITYGSITAALRGLGHALAGADTQDVQAFESLGIMLDCSRNAVMRVPNLKRWMRRLALLGYNRILLYTEDTYQLAGEPYFGYMRGGYSASEIRELDAYAASLGIEMMACMQTLAHLEQILKWKHYAPISDTPHILLVDEEATDALIGKMLDFWAANLRTRRIHIGMDEAHMLGRGQFLDRHGYEPQFSIFNRHLAKVCASCESRGLKPMIWSDMYFRMGSATQDYYDRNAVIPDDVRKKIPPSVELVYWDYYHEDEAFYRDFIRRHRDLGFEPLMGSGIWTWARFWYDHRKTVATVTPCLDACRKEKVKEVFFTMWGDGGSYCEFDSALAGLTWAADLSWGGTGEEERLAPLFRAVCGGDYRTQLIAGDLRVSIPEIGGDDPALATGTMLWDDPLLGIGWQGYAYAGPDFWGRVQEQLENLREALAPVRDDRAVADLGYAYALCDLLVRKLSFRAALLSAYIERDAAALDRLADEEIPAIQSALEVLQEAFRRQWLRRNKPFGMEVIQIRLGAQQTRYAETARRIRELREGTVDQIEELEAARDDLGPNRVGFFDWLATGCNII